MPKDSGSIMLLCSLWAMAYTGTRTAFGLVPIGATFFAGLIMSKRIINHRRNVGIAGYSIVLKSTSSGVIYRIQSAFKPSSDASMNRRLENQKKIQPLIQNDHLSMGLGSCRVWGRALPIPIRRWQIFHMIRVFVRMGVELGWIGLLLYTLFHYVVLEPVCTILSDVGSILSNRCMPELPPGVYAVIACYFQEAILQLPMNVLYNVFLGMLVTLKNFDLCFQKKHKTIPTIV
ncbi:MAG: hypothetical protein R2778_19355 [Saprospiraceae bacterium]